jgi:CheY-like chemotaxis protein
MIETTITQSQLVPPSGPSHPATRILLVDDHLDSVVSMGRLLRLLGYEVRAALDGANALVCAGEFRPDVALIDLSLPGLDGYTVARRIRALEATRETRLIAISGWATKDCEWRTRDAGFEMHLLKPVSMGDLTAALTSAMAHPHC